MFSKKIKFRSVLLSVFCLGYGIACPFSAATSSSKDVTVKIIDVESTTRVDIHPMSGVMPAYRIRGVILAPRSRPNEQLLVNILPVPVQLDGQGRGNAIPIKLSGFVGSTPVTQQTQIPVSLTGNFTVPFDITGIPALEPSKSALLPAGCYFGTFTLQARRLP